MPTYRWNAEPGELVAPALIVSFEDWVDAGGAGSTAARHIAAGGDLVATFHADALYDYRSHRPILDIVDGLPSRFEWPRMSLVRRRYAERDLFVLTGPEPDFRWREFSSDVADIAVRLGVLQHVSLGAIPSAVPHTVPTPLMMTASSKELMGAEAPSEGLLRVPAAAVSAVEWVLAERGVPAVGFWAQVPHYATPYAAGAIALVRRVENHLSVTIGAGALEEQDREQRRALQQVFANDPEAGAYLERLERLAGDQPIPPAERIAEEVERFLRNRQEGDGRSAPFGS